MKKPFLQIPGVLVLFILTISSFGQNNNQNKLPDWAFGGFLRPGHVNPIISPDPGSKFLDPMTNKSISWECSETFNPAAVIKNGKVIVLYRAEDNSGIGRGSRTSRIGFAISSDGIHFTKSKSPVLFPGNDSQKEFDWPGGCEDPRVAVTEDGTYVVTYTSWNRKVPRLGVAISKDLKNWTKYNPILMDAYNGKFHNMFTKSASIVTMIKGGKQVIAKINGKYWMYWGEHHIYAATSTNLINWVPLVDDKNELKILMSPRKGYFDSNLTECGPPAVITDKGIVLLYNGKNLANEDRDKRFNANAYCAGQVLFDKNDPTKVLARLDVPFLRPVESFEKSGQYEDGTVFVEGMVYFKKKWFLYYGCADSRVGVAIFDPDKISNGDSVPTL